MMDTDPMDFSIKEDSLLAAMAAGMLRSGRMAIVFRNTIHLYKVTKADFLKNEKWLRHEMCHISQFRRYGTLRFTLMYLWESLRRGYQANRFEEEARRFAESKP